LFPGRAAAPATLLSQDRPAFASSVESGGTPANAVDDGDATTRWSSAFTDRQWIQFDLGGTAAIRRVVLRWDSAYARAFALQTSRDAKAWTTVYTTSAGSGGVQTVPVSASGRYVRVLGISRATRYGYSLREFQVYGTLPPPRGRFVRAEPQVAGVQPSHATPPPTYFHEFQANCRATHDLMDDPIVHPGQPGGPISTLSSATPRPTPTAPSPRCAPAAAPARLARTGPPTGSRPCTTGPASPTRSARRSYYKSGVTDYRSVRPFPPGLRFVVGDPGASPAQFLAASVQAGSAGTATATRTSRRDARPAPN